MIVSKVRNPRFVTICRGGTKEIKQLISCPRNQATSVLANFRQLAGERVVKIPEGRLVAIPSPR